MCHPLFLCVLPRNGCRHSSGPQPGFAFGVFLAVPIVGGFAGVGGVELSDRQSPRVGREVVQFADALGGRGANLDPELVSARAGRLGLRRGRGRVGEIDRGLQSVGWLDAADRSRR